MHPEQIVILICYTCQAKFTGTEREARSAGWTFGEVDKKQFGNGTRYYYAWNCPNHTASDTD